MIAKLAQLLAGDRPTEVTGRTSDLGLASRELHRGPPGSATSRHRSGRSTARRRPATRSMGTQGIEREGLRRDADGRDRLVARAALPGPRLRHRDARRGARAALPRARRPGRRRRARSTGNVASERVSEKLGYVAAGEGVASPRGEPVREQHFRLERERLGAPRPHRRSRSSGSSRACRSSACSLGRMAAPVQREEELELAVDSLAFGGNGVARLDGFVVFVRARAAGRHRPRARDEGAAPPRRGGWRSRSSTPGPQRVEAPCAHFPACGGCRFQDLAYEAQLAAKQAWVEDSLRRIAGHRRAAARADRRRRGGLRLPQQDGVLVRARRRTARSSACTAPAAGTRCSGSSAAGSRPTSATRSATRCATGRARSGSRRTTRPTGKGYLRHLVVREGREHRPGARPARHPRARALRPRAADRGADAVPGGALDPLGGQRHAGRGDEPADASCSGATRRSRRSSAACASACGRTRSCRRTRAWPSGCTSSPAPRPR